MVFLSNSDSNRNRMLSYWSRNEFSFSSFPNRNRLSQISLQYLLQLLQNSTAGEIKIHSHNEVIYPKLNPFSYQTYQLNTQKWPQYIGLRLKPYENCTRKLYRLFLILDLRINILCNLLKKTVVSISLHKLSVAVLAKIQWLLYTPHLVWWNM